jgi:hypothetical protein
MKIQIDLKSALAGLALGITALFAVGAGTSSNPAGKFQAVTCIGGYALILDTQTGQAWAVPSNGQLEHNSSAFWNIK